MIGNQKAIEAIKSNYPPENYSILREALDLSIVLLEKATPKKCLGLSISHDGRLGNCPYCNKLVCEKSSKPNICECGQKLNWD